MRGSLRRLSLREASIDAASGARPLLPARMAEELAGEPEFRRLCRNSVPLVFLRASVETAPRGPAGPPGQSDRLRREFWKLGGAAGYQEIVNGNISRSPSGSASRIRSTFSGYPNQQRHRKRLRGRRRRTRRRVAAERLRNPAGRGLGLTPGRTETATRGTPTFRSPRCNRPTRQAGTSQRPARRGGPHADPPDEQTEALQQPSIRPWPIMDCRSSGPPGVFRGDLPENHSEANRRKSSAP